jgi:hypothetical protein
MLGALRYPGRFNLFQRAMLRWRDLHPYNAVHVMTIDQPLERERLARSVNGTLARMGLASLTVDRARRRYRYDAQGTPVVVAERPAGADAFATMRAEMQAQLNEPFPDGLRQTPFRCFAVVEKERFHVGLAYDHFIAGGDSIVRLMQAVHAAYLGVPQTGPAGEPPALYPPTYRSVVARRLRATVSDLRDMPDALLRARRSARPRYDDVTDARNAFLLERLDARTFAGAVRTAKAWGVTVNDFFLAALLHAMAPFAEARQREKPDLQIGVASIVNIRAEFALDDDRTFGQFLASFRVGHRVPAGISLKELAQDVQRQTMAIKRDKHYLRIILALAFAHANWPFLSRPRRHRFFPRTYPLWGGVTMLNVDALWPEHADGARPAGYVRGVPTGPLTPFVLAVTTYKAAASLGVSFRPSVFAPEVAAQILARIAAAVAQTALEESA